MEIDYIITNPPYNKTLYLEILEYLIINCKGSEIVSVNPNQHLVDILAVSGYKNKTAFSNYKDSVYRHIKQAMFFNKDTFDKMFKISYLGCGAIYYIVPSGNYDVYKTAFQEMNKNGYVVYDVLMRIIKKVISEEVLYYHYRQYETGNLVGVGRVMSGYIKGDLLYGVHKRVYKSKMDYLDKYCGVDVEVKKELPRKFINFNTHDEAQNFIDCFDTEFMRFYMKGIHEGVDTMFRFIPLLDMSKKWTNERLCEYYNVSEEEFKMCLEWFNN